MKKQSSKLRVEIAKLQEQLRHAETRDAERIGRIALRAGLGEVEVEDADLQAALEDLAQRFPRGRTTGKAGSNGTEKRDGREPAQSETAPVKSGAASGQAGEA